VFRGRTRAKANRFGSRADMCSGWKTRGLPTSAGGDEEPTRARALTHCNIVVYYIYIYVGRYRTIIYLYVFKHKYIPNDNVIIMIFLHVRAWCTKETRVVEVHTYDCVGIIRVPGRGIRARVCSCKVSVGGCTWTWASVCGRRTDG